MAYAHIDHIDFKCGFEIGFRAIKGRSAALPPLPAQPTGARGQNMTPFLMGVRVGLEVAGIHLDPFAG